MFRTPREDLGKILKSFDGKVVFVLKVYDLIIPNMKIFLEVKKFNNCFVGYPVKILILAVSCLAMFFWTLLKPFHIESNVLKRFALILDSW